MPKTVTDHITQCLGNLSADELKRFKYKLCELKKMVYGLIETQGPASLALSIISKYTEIRAIKCTVDVLKAIDLNDAAKKLSDTQKPACKPPTAALRAGNQQKQGQAKPAAGRDKPGPSRLPAQPSQAQPASTKKRKQPALRAGNQQKQGQAKPAAGRDKPGPSRLPAQPSQAQPASTKKRKQPELLGGKRGQANGTAGRTQPGPAKPQRQKKRKGPDSPEHSVAKKQRLACP